MIFFQMMKTIPVTAVTPLSRPPLPNATTVPSRFTLSSASSVDTVPVNFSGTEDGEPEPYSLWYVCKITVGLEKVSEILHNFYITLLLVGSSRIHGS